MTWFVDGYEFQSYTANDIQPKYSWPFEQNFHLIMNLAVGGNWPGPPDSSSVFPATLEVDYVRVLDLSASGSPGSITGPSLLHQTQSAEYCVAGITAQSINWQLPAGATSSAGSSSSCILVTFGSTSGYVEASVTSNCGTETLRAPVTLRPFYGKEFSFATGSSTIGQSTGVQTSVTEDGAPAIKYDRDIAELYDNIIFPTSLIPDASAYQSASKRFFIDVKCETCAPCTRVMVQLEELEVPRFKLLRPWVLMSLLFAALAMWIM